MIKSAFGDSKSFTAYPEQLGNSFHALFLISCWPSAILVSRPTHKYSLRQTYSNGQFLRPPLCYSFTNWIPTCYASLFKYFMVDPIFWLTLSCLW